MKNRTFSLSSRSIFAPGIVGASAFVKLDEYFGRVGGGIGRAAIAGFSCCLFELWMPAVGAAVEKLAIYEPGDERTGLVGGTGGGPLGGVGCVGVLIFLSLFFVLFLVYLETL